MRFAPRAGERGRDEVLFGARERPEGGGAEPGAGGDDLSAGW